MAQQQPTQLSDAERQALMRSLQARLLDAQHMGYLSADAKTPTDQCVVADFANTATGDVSVCGAKNMLIQELRRFTTPQGESKPIRCATAAVLEMTDSPVHVHASTLEFYIVLSGQGTFILGTGDDERLVPVQEGSVILLPPGQPHGMVSDDPDVPVRALMTFTPGLAPKDEPAYRDEAVIHPRASDRLQAIRDKQSD